MQPQQGFELENRIPALYDFVAAEIIWFSRPSALTAGFRVRLLCTQTFQGFVQPGLSLITVGIPDGELPASRVLLKFGVKALRRDYPRVTCCSLQEALIAIASHELYHLCCSQYRGDLGETDGPDPDVIELTPEALEEIGAWNLERVYTRRLSVDGFSEERAADIYALQRLRAWRRRGFPLKRPSVLTVLGESEKPLLVLRRREAVIL